MKSIRCVLLLFLFAMAFNTRAAKPEEIQNAWPEDIQLLVDSGDYYTDSNPILALEFYYKAIQLAEEKEVKDHGMIYSQIAHVYKRQSLLAEALDNYLKAASMYKKHEHSDHNLRMGWVYVDIGNVYYALQKQDKAREYYDKASVFFREEGFTYGLATIKNNLGLLYQQAGKTDSAQACFIEVLELRKRDSLAGIGLSYEYLAEVYAENDLSRSRKAFFNAIAYHKKNNEARKVARAYGGLANVMYKYRMPDSAIYYANKAVDIYHNYGDSLSMSDRIMNIGHYYQSMDQLEKAERYYLHGLKITKPAGLLYQQNVALQQLYQIELKRENYKKALAYYKRKVEIEDSINSEDVARKLNRVELKYLAMDREKKLQIKEQQSKIKSLYIWSISIVSVLMLAFLIIIINRQRKAIHAKQQVIEKNKTIREKEQELLKAQENERKLLEKELKEKKNELVNFALHIAQRNDFLADLKESVKKLDRISEKELPASKKKLIMKINQGLQINKDFEEFNMQVEKVHKEFLRSLEERFPELTKNEKRLASMLRLNLSSKEIAAVNNTSVKAVEMGRYRLRRKLGLDKGININDFFKNFD